VRLAATPGGGSRGALWKTGCGAALVVLAGLLIASFLVLDRGVDWLVVRARERVEASLPVELDPATRRRLLDGLEDFVSGLPAAPDRDAATGRFLARVGAALEDRRLTPAEAGELADFLDATRAAWRGQRVDAPEPSEKR